MNNKENQTWYNIDWKQINSTIELLQNRISEASIFNQVEMMYEIQHQLLNSVGVICFLRGRNIFSLLIFNIKDISFV